MTVRDALLGRTLADFTVRERLGEGAFGAVYRADQAGLDRQAVIKVLHERHQGREELKKRFLREARLASRLDHPYAAHIYAFGAEPDGLLWLAMEQVRGTLLSLVRTMPAARFVPFFERLCEVVHTAHEQGIVHRDIKPSNIMVIERAGQLLPKLLDFGIAKSLGDPASLGPPGQAGDDSRLDETSGAEEPKAASVTGDLAETREADIDVSLTWRGGVVGSPAYMAPEQWLRSPSVGAETDVYALAVVAYELLAGRRPFEGKTVVELLRAQREHALPPVGAQLPAAVDAFFEKALASSAKERHGSALELGRALRQAVGLSVVEVELPRLPPALLERTLPQPIAEAVAALAAARRAHQAFGAARLVVTVVVRYLAAIALAARAAAESATDSPRLGELLRTLHRGGLSDEEWLELTGELCQPFRERPEGHVVPELVRFLARPHGLERLCREAPPPPRSSDAEVVALLGGADALLPRLAMLLDEARFLEELVLAVPRAGTADGWMGVRRSRRTTPCRRHLSDGHPYLLSSEGTPLLGLWPFVQLAAPSPGAAEELFFFDGQARLGPRLVAFPDLFEHHDGALWDWIGRHLFETRGQGRNVDDKERAPYRGLSSFTAEDADLFIGREREIETLLNRLRVQPFVALVGPSGAGKSSLVSAGLLPSLVDKGFFEARASVVTLRPGALPMTALTRQLERAAIGLSDLGAGTHAPLILFVDQFEETFTLCKDEAERQRFIALLVEAAARSDGPLRLIVTLRDDFLVRAQEEPALSERLAQAIQIVSTPSSQQLIRILTEPARRRGYDFDDRTLPSRMVEVLQDRPGVLPLLSFTAMKLWEERDRNLKQLTARAYDALGGVAGALAQHAEQTLMEMPLPERSLVRALFRHLVTADGTRAVLERASIEQALGARAGAVVEKLVSARLLVSSESENGEVQIEIVHETLLSSWPRLVAWRQEDEVGARLRDQLRTAARQWEERGRPAGLLWRDDALEELVRWRRKESEPLAGIAAAFADASALVALRARRRARLLSSLALGVLVAGVLGLLTLSQRSRQSGAVARAVLGQMYEENGRRALLEDDPGRALVYLNAARREGRSSPALDFMADSSIQMLSMTRAIYDHGAPLLEATFSADGQWVITRAIDGTAKIWERGGRLVRALGAGDVHGVETLGSDLVVAGQGSEVSVWRLRDGALLHKMRVSEAVTRVRPFGGKANLVLVTGRRTVSLVDPVEGKVVWQHEASDGEIVDVTASPDGAFVARLGTSSTQLLDGASGRIRGALLAGYGTGASFGAGRVLVSNLEGIGAVFDLTSTSERLRIGSPKRPIRGGRLARDGRLVVAGADGVSRLYDAGGGEIAQLGHHGGDRFAGFDARSERILTTAEDGTARVWDAARGTLIAVLAGHRGSIYNRRFDGHVLTFGSDGTARDWDPDAGPLALGVVVRDRAPHRVAVVDRETVMVSGPASIEMLDVRDGELRRRIPIAGPVDATYLAPEGRGYATVQGDVVTLHDAGGEPRLKVHNPSPVTLVGISPDGTLVSASDETLRLWDASGRQRHLLAGHTAPVLAVAFSPDGRKLASVSVDHSLRVWDTSTGAFVLRLNDFSEEVNGVIFDSKGSQLISTSWDCTARVVDVASGRVLATLAGHNGVINGVTMSRDEQLIVTGSDDRTLRVWSRQGVLLATHRLMSAVLSVDVVGDSVVTTSQDGVLRVWRLPAAHSAVAAARVERCMSGWELREGVLGRRRPESCDLARVAR